MTMISRPAWLLLALVFLPSAGLAHRLDEYLQATLVSIDPGEVRLRINLTPGVEVAEQVLSRIDRDRNGVISTNEASAYANLLKRDLDLRVDNRKVKLDLISCHSADMKDLRSGWGIIQVEFSASPGSLRPGAHRLILKNRHLADLSVYLFNAAQPKSGSVQITGQKRNESQSTGEIDFTVQ